VLKAQATLQQTLRTRGWDLTWSEFPAGPQLLEAMNAGSLDFGYTGGPPPISAQAADNDLVYFGAEPIGPSTEAIVVKRGSPVAGVPALKGRSVAVQKGSSAHFLLLAALTRVGLGFAEIQPVYLAPSYARAAFESDRVDAWVIWDPYLASAQASDELRLVLRELAAAGAWAAANPQAAAQLLAPPLGLPVAVVEAWQRRARYGVKHIDAAVVASQQTIADAFLQQRLIPKKIEIAGAVWQGSNTGT
jgi:sulfonate transport system substrate-binding protein